MSSKNQLVPSNKFWSAFWFALSMFLLGIVCGMFLWTDWLHALVMSTPVAGMAYILFLLGCQRSRKYSKNERLMSNRILITSLVATFSAVIAGVILS